MGLDGLQNHAGLPAGRPRASFMQSPPHAPLRAALSLPPWATPAPTLNAPSLTLLAASLCTPSCTLIRPSSRGPSGSRASLGTGFPSPLGHPPSLQRALTRPLCSGNLSGSPSRVPQQYLCLSPPGHHRRPGLSDQPPTENKESGQEVSALGEDFIFLPIKCQSLYDKDGNKATSSVWWEVADHWHTLPSCCDLCCQRPPRPPAMGLTCVPPLDSYSEVLTPMTSECDLV